MRRVVVHEYEAGVLWMNLRVLQSISAGAPQGNTVALGVPQCLVPIERSAEATGKRMAE